MCIIEIIKTTKFCKTGHFLNPIYNMRLEQVYPFCEFLVVFPRVNNQTSQKLTLNHICSAFNMQKKERKFLENMDHFLVYSQILTHRQSAYCKKQTAEFHVQTTRASHYKDLHHRCLRNFASFTSFIWGLSEHGLQGSIFLSLLFLSILCLLYKKILEACPNRLYTSSSLVLYISLIKIFLT